MSAPSSRGASTTEARAERFGDTATVNGTTRYNDSFITPVVAPGSTVVVKFFKGGELTTTTYDAAQVAANLGPLLKKR